LEKTFSAYLSDLNSKSFVWPISPKGEFYFPENLNSIQSEFGNKINTLLGEVNNGLQIFMRGSYLEELQPFVRADLDLFIVYDESCKLETVKALLPVGYDYDVKLLKKGKIDVDFVYSCLLNCRSIQISGQPFIRQAIAANKEFALQHWVKYCPSILPNELNSSQKNSIIYFKLLVRCFGVLSFLKYKMFTRNISECLIFAELEMPEHSKSLYGFKSSLELQRDDVLNIDLIKRDLYRAFDRLYSVFS
jgi:hypothetical protein